MPDTARLVCFVSGRVQGVGFRWWTRSRALELGLTGYARNTDDGRVEVCAEGPSEALDALLDALRGDGAASGRPGWVEAVSDPIRTAATGNYQGFRER